MKQCYLCYDYSSGYRVEKKDTQKGRWEPVKDNIKGSEFTVPKLTEGRDYHFRVTAVNDNGESDFLETEKATTAKNPFGKHCFFLISRDKYVLKAVKDVNNIQERCVPTVFMHAFLHFEF